MCSNNSFKFNILNDFAVSPYADGKTEIWFNNVRDFLSDSSSLELTVKPEYIEQLHNIFAYNRFNPLYEYIPNLYERVTADNMGDILEEIINVADPNPFGSYLLYKFFKHNIDVHLRGDLTVSPLSYLDLIYEILCDFDDSYILESMANPYFDSIFLSFLHENGFGCFTQLDSFILSIFRDYHKIDVVFEKLGEWDTTIAQSDETVFDIVREPTQTFIGKSFSAFKSVPDSVLNLNAISQNYKQLSASNLVAATELEAMAKTLHEVLDGIIGKCAKLYEGFDFSSYPMQLSEFIIDIFTDLYAGVSIPLTRWLTYISRLLRLFGISSISLASTIVNKFSSFFSSFSLSTVAQASNEASNVLLSLVGCIITKAFPTDRFLKSANELFRFYNYTIPFSNDIKTLLVSALSMLPNCVKVWIDVLFPNLFWKEQLDGQAGECSEWIRAVTAFLDNESMYSVNYDNRKVEVLKLLYEKSILYGEMFASTSFFPVNFSLLFRNVQNRLSAFYQEWRSTVNVGSARKTPLCIYLYGGSQIGKSTVAGTLGKYLYPNVPDDILRYVRKVSDDFWSGYIGQPVTCYDDFGQNAEMTEALEIFDIVTNAPYVLNMPSLTDSATGKKGTLFRSELVVCCSNTGFPNVRNVVTSEEAFFKRRHLLVKVELKDPSLPVVYKPAFGHLTFTVMETYDTNQARPLRIFEQASDFFNYVKDFKVSHEMKQLECQVWETELLESLTQAQGLDWFSAPVAAATVTLADITLGAYARRASDKVLQAIDDAHTAAARAVMDNPNAMIRIHDNLADTVSEGRKKLAFLQNAVTVSTYISTAIIAFFSARTIWKAFKNRSSAEHGGYAHKDTVIRSRRVVAEGSKTRTKLSFAGGSGTPYVGRRPEFDKEKHLFYLEDPNGIETHEIMKLNAFINHGIIAEGTTDMNAFQISTEVIAPRVGYITLFREDGTCRSMCCLPLGGTVLMVPHHLFVDPEGGMVHRDSRIELNVEGVIFRTHFEPKNMIRLQNIKGAFKDVVLYKFGKELRSFRDITSLFVTEQDLSNIVRSEALMLKYNKCNRESQLLTVKQILHPEEYSANSARFVLSGGWSYEATTQGGDCGSPIVLFNTKLSRKLIGIHIAGRVGTHIGFAELVTQEMLLKAKILFEGEVMNFQSGLEGLTEDGVPMINLQGNLSYFGLEAPNRCYLWNKKTAVRKSEIFDKIYEHTTVPGILADNDPRNVNHVRIGDASIGSKFGDIGFPIRNKESDLILSHLCEIVDQWKCEKGVVFDETVAINGDASRKYVDRMNMETAVGYPYHFVKTRKPGSGKKWLFAQKGCNTDLRYEVEHPLLRKRLDDRLELAKQGLRMESRNFSSLKDERVGFHKILNPKARHFSIFPTDYTVLSRQYFLDFVDYFYANHLKFFSAVGIDVYSQDWGNLVENLLANSDIGFAGDYKYYDGKLVPKAMSIAFDMITYFYRNEDNHKENTLIRAVLFNEMIHTVEQTGNVVWAKHGGNPSGHNLTTVVNSIVGEIYLANAWLNLAPPLYRSMKSFNENVVRYIYGDDNIVSVKRDVIDFYNMETYADFMKTMNITYTPPDKISDVTHSQKILDMSFLKCKIRKEGMIYYAMLDEKSIHEMTNWTKESLDNWVATVDNCNTALRFMWFHGPEKFRDFRIKIANALLQHDKPFQLYTYQYLEDCYMEYGSLSDVIEKEKYYNVAQSDDTETTMSHVKGEATPVGETREINSVSFVETSMPVTRSLPGSIDPIMIDTRIAPEPTWDAKRLLGKPMKVGTYSWPASSTQLTSIKTFDVVAQARLNSVWNNVLSMFRYFRAKVHFRIEVNGIRFDSGRLIAYIVPFTNATAHANTIAKSLVSQTMLVHDFVDACDNSVCELEAPFYYPFSHFTLNGLSTLSTNTVTDDPWRFALSVFNPLRYGTGAATSVNVSVFMWFTDVDLKVPVPATVAQGNTTSFNYNMTGWDKVSNIVLPNNVTGDAFDVSAKVRVSGMDKPLNTIQPMGMVKRPFGYTSHGSNIESFERLSLDPSYLSLATPSHFGTTQDEMDIKYLTSKMTYLDTETITTSQTTGAFIQTLAINPAITAHGQVYSGTNTVANTMRNLPLLAYVSLPFARWRGSIRVRIDFVATSFHTGKFAFTVNYGGLFDPALNTALDTTSQYTTFIELNGEKKCFEFNIPYIADMPYKRVQNNVPVSGTGGDNMRMYLSSIGYWSLTIVNPLVAPTNVSNTIDVNFFIGGGDDFELGYPGGGMSSLFPPLGSAQGDSIGDCQLSDAAGPQTMSAITMNGGFDKVTSLKTLLKRYQQAFTFAGFGSEAENGVAVPLNSVLAGVQNQLAGPWNNTGGFNVSNLLSYFTPMYRSLVGGLRLKIMMDVQIEDANPDAHAHPFVWWAGLTYTPEWLNAVYTGGGQIPDLMFPAATFNPSSVNQGSNHNKWNTTLSSPISYCNSLTPYFEVEIPYSQPFITTKTIIDISELSTEFAYTNAGVYYKKFISNLGTISIGLPRYDDAIFTVKAKAYMLMSAADDFRLGGLIQCPGVIYNSNVNGDLLSANTFDDTGV